jgi:hypothetical protein
MGQSICVLPHSLTMLTVSPLGFSFVVVGVGRANANEPPLSRYVSMETNVNTTPRDDEEATTEKREVLTYMTHTRASSR